MLGLNKMYVLLLAHIGLTAVMCYPVIWYKISSRDLSWLGRQPTTGHKQGQFIAKDHLGVCCGGCS